MNATTTQDDIADRVKTLFMQVRANDEEISRELGEKFPKVAASFLGGAVAGLRRKPSGDVVSTTATKAKELSRTSSSKSSNTTTNELEAGSEGGEEDSENDDQSAKVARKRNETDDSLMTAPQSPPRPISKQSSARSLWAGLTPSRSKEGSDAGAPAPKTPTNQFFEGLQQRFQKSSNSGGSSSGADTNTKSAAQLIAELDPKDQEALQQELKNWEDRPILSNMTSASRAAATASTASIPKRTSNPFEGFPFPFQSSSSSSTRPSSSSPTRDLDPGGRDATPEDATTPAKD